MTPVARENSVCYNKIPMPKEQDRLHLQALQEQFKPEDLAEHKRWGIGIRLRFGSTLVDMYPHPDNILPVISLRGRRSRLLLGDVLNVEITGGRGLHIRHVDGEVIIQPNGDYVHAFTASVEPDVIPFQEASVGQKKGEYMQTMLEAPGGKEGERVEKYGSIEAAPKPANKGKDSPLQFFLLVENPEKEGEVERLEVYAKNMARQKLQGYKLVKGDRIRAVLYKHTWDDETMGGNSITYTRYNLAAVIEIERKEDEQDAKRQTGRRRTSKE